MKKARSILGSTKGLTLVELVVTVAIMAILMEIASATWTTLQAKIRSSQSKADMDGIAQAGYTDYANNLGVWAPLTFGAEPASFAASNLLNHWPTAPCPGMYFSWEDWSPFDINVVRVTLRRADNTALWSYCVDVYGGGNCQAVDPLYGGQPIEISTTTVTYLYCNE